MSQLQDRLRLKDAELSQRINRQKSRAIVFEEESSLTIVDPGRNRRNCTCCQLKTCIVTVKNKAAPPPTRGEALDQQLLKKALKLGVADSSRKLSLSPQYSLDIANSFERRQYLQLIEANKKQHEELRDLKTRFKSVLLSCSKYYEVFMHEIVSYNLVSKQPLGSQEMKDLLARYPSVCAQFKAATKLIDEELDLLESEDSVQLGQNQLAEVLLSEPTLFTCFGQQRSTRSLANDCLKLKELIKEAQAKPFSSIQNYKTAETAKQPLCNQCFKLRHQLEERSSEAQELRECLLREQNSRKRGLYEEDYLRLIMLQAASLQQSVRVQ